LVDQFIDDSREDEQTLRQGRELLEQVLQDKDNCDAMLLKYARNWELSRLALVDRNILRLAVAEMRLRRTPRKVAITEAIKLAQEFSTAESPRFVNGVLDAVAREIFGEHEDKQG
jgi:N utilization substance protein B